LEKHFFPLEFLHCL